MTNKKDAVDADAVIEIQMVVSIGISMPEYAIDSLLANFKVSFASLISALSCSMGQEDV